MQRSWAAPFLSVGFAVLLAGCQERSGATDTSASREPVGVVLADVPGDPVARIYGFGTHPDGYFLLDGPAARVLLIGRDGSKHVTISLNSVSRNSKPWIRELLLTGKAQYS